MYTIAGLCIDTYIKTFALEPSPSACCLYSDTMYRACNTCCHSVLWISCFATGGRFRLTPITVLLERGKGFFRVVPTLWKRADQKKKDRRKQYSGRRRPMQADSDSQPCRRDPVSGQLYFPSQIYLGGEAKMLATSYRLVCTPLSRPTHCNWHRAIETKQWLSQTITNRTQVIVLSVRHSCLWNWTGD